MNNFFDLNLYNNKVANIPELKTLIEILKCNKESPLKQLCVNCPYKYNRYYKDEKNIGFWMCDEQRLKEDSLFYLILYRIKLEKEKEIQSN